MYFVYFLKSISFPDKMYVGYTSNVQVRLAEHNVENFFHTSKYKPWEIITSFGFKEQSKALAFEKYLKSGSGRVFIKKHFL
ncbi:MAG: GIY-YIG nuclease family protein [Candidatus Dependentiae bacterium]